MKKIILSTLVLGAMLNLASCTKETGCTDPSATNYDSDAEESDNSCQYAKDDTPASEVVITASAAGTGTVTWSKDKTYILDGIVFVNSGQTLTIEAGTVIKGSAGEAANASALVVARGAKIMAEGTASMPIIFTSEADATTRDGDGNLVQSNALNETQAGLWGGLIILGNAGLNSEPGETAIEGIETTEARGLYGGNDDDDNSGVIKYVSIRHGGTNIGANNEINGLSLGGVGRGTTIDFVEIYANADDGIEFFGGTVEAKHLLVSSVGDDSFDYDEGFRGKGQYWVSLNPGDRHGEHDGGTDPETAQPYATPTIYNATYIGNESKLTFRDNAGGTYSNSILLVAKIDVENLPSGEDSKSRLDDGDLMIKGNVIDAVTVIVDSENASLVAHANVDDNSVVATGVTTTNPVPASATTATGLSGDTFIEDVSYKGAFSGTNWAAGWTRTFE
jgi:hypothetical protein